MDLPMMIAEDGKGRKRKFIDVTKLSDEQCGELADMIWGKGGQQKPRKSFGIPSNNSGE